MLKGRWIGRTFKAVDDSEMVVVGEVGRFLDLEVVEGGQSGQNEGDTFSLTTSTFEKYLSEGLYKELDV